MAKLLTNPRIQLTKLDRLAFDPEKGAYSDIAWWAKLYFDAQVFPWQQYFYHHPAKNKLVIAGIRTGKTHLAGFGFAHMGMYHNAIKLLNVSISSEQAKYVYYKLLDIFNHDTLKHWVADVLNSSLHVAACVHLVAITPSASGAKRDVWDSDAGSAVVPTWLG
jgi:hypothetical protein